MENFIFCAVMCATHPDIQYTNKIYANLINSNCRKNWYSLLINVFRKQKKQKNQYKYLKNLLNDQTV